MGAALHLAYVHQPAPAKRKRKRGGGGDGGGYVIPAGSCDPCRDHWHHKCHGVDLLLPDDERPDCPCPCGDPRDPMRLNPAAWTDLAEHAPGEVWKAATMERHRAEGVFACYLDEDGRHRSAVREWRRER